MTQPPADAPFDTRHDGEARDPGAGVLRPRHAATLIIVRRDAAKPRLLMGRRNRGHAFMPDKWVFPGGRVERCDYAAPAASELTAAAAARLARQARHRNPPSLARAVALAAVRETFEETGLLLARPAPPRPGVGGWRAFLGHGALPDLAALDVVARAITPPYRNRRFDARFLMAHAEALISLERRGDDGELDEIAWVDFDEALALDLPNITRFVVSELTLRLNDPARPAPFMRFLNGARRLTYL